MRAFRVCLFVLLAVGGPAAADDAQLRKLARAKVEEINNAVIKEDYARVADLTHPKVTELMGGREKMISSMETGMKRMKDQGYALRSAKVGEPSDLVAAGPELYLVVPFDLEMKAPGGKLRVKSFVIGVSGDKGKSWTFVNADFEGAKIKEILPNLPDKLKLPAKEKPVFEKDDKGP